MDALKPAVRWLKSYWDEEDVLYFFEADEDGWVLRQVELRGPDRTPAVAAYLAEWPDANRDGLGGAGVRGEVRRACRPAYRRMGGWVPAR